VATRPGYPAQIHCTAGDPFRSQERLDALASDIRTVGGPIEIFGYPGTGHLFTDPSLPTEYDEQARPCAGNAPWHSAAHRSGTHRERRPPAAAIRGAG
jgi:dienelactone hydrolase